jgi:chemotaxis signal transduction protein
MKTIDVEQSERYCVFQMGDEWFAFPALAIRSVVPRPILTPVPYSDPVLQGLCHLQNEFLPVFSLRALINSVHDPSAHSEQQLMLMMGLQGPWGNGPWGLLIDRAVALVPLETSISSYSNCDDNWSRVIVGSATYSSHVLQVLDAKTIFQYVSNLLEMHWQPATSST